MGDTAATDSYRVLLSGGEGEIVEKKSRFIATIRKCETEEEAVAFIEEMKKKYWDARHNCSASVSYTHLNWRSQRLSPDSRAIPLPVPASLLPLRPELP